MAEHALRTSNTNFRGIHLLQYRTSVRSVVRSRVEASPLVIAQLVERSPVEFSRLCRTQSAIGRRFDSVSRESPEQRIRFPSGAIDIRCSIVASIPACHAGDPGSIPGGGVIVSFDSSTSEVAQRKRAGPITQRSEDRNLVSLHTHTVPATSPSTVCLSSVGRATDC